MNDAELGALLDEFKRLYTAGDRPDPAEFLARAGASADDFAELLDMYLAEHPQPALSGAELDRMASGALFAPPTWPQLLVEARQQHGVLRSDVVTRLTSALGLRPEQHERVAEHLHDLETGMLAPRGVSQRVIDALDGIFRGIGTTLDRTRLLEPPTPTASGAFARDASSDVDVPDQHSEPDAEVDALFLGRADR